MSIQKNIGKNTIGDNNKMSVSLHEYNMSTHDLSTITRTSMSPGTRSEEHTSELQSHYSRSYAVFGLKKK